MFWERHGENKRINGGGEVGYNCVKYAQEEGSKRRS